MAYSNCSSLQIQSPRRSIKNNSDNGKFRFSLPNRIHSQRLSQYSMPLELGNYTDADSNEATVSIKEINLINEPDTQNQEYSPQSSFTTHGLESSSDTFVENDLEINRTASGKLSEDFSGKHSFCDTIKSEGVLSIKLKTDAIAWVLVFFVVLLRAAIMIFNNTFTPIPLITAHFLGTSLTSVNWLYNATFITYIISCFFTSWLYESIGVKWSLVFSGIILSLGCWIRWIAVKMSPPSFSILIVGQIIASFSAPISTNITTTFAALWFTENLRATASMFIVSNYGSIIAMFLLPKIATGSDRIEFTMVVVGCIATATTLPLFLFPKKPQRVTSYNALGDVNKYSTKSKVSLRRGAILLLKSPHFLILSMIHGLNTGIANAWSVVMNQVITPYEYSDSQVGNIAAIGVIGGILGCLISGPVLDKTKQHKILLKLMAPLMFSTYVAFIFVVKAESFAAILYVNFLSQFFLNFMIPICIELGVEVLYPVPESLSTSILWLVSKVLGIVLTTAMDLLRDSKSDMFRALVFQAIVAGICFILSCVFNGPMLRLKAFEEQENLRKNTLCAIQPSAKLLHPNDSYTLKTLEEKYIDVDHKHAKD